MFRAGLLLIIGSNYSVYTRTAIGMCYVSVGWLLQPTNIMHGAYQLYRQTSTSWWWSV